MMGVTKAFAEHIVSLGIAGPGMIRAATADANSLDDIIIYIFGGTRSAGDGRWSLTAAVVSPTDPIVTLAGPDVLDGWMW